MVDEDGVWREATAEDLHGLAMSDGSEYARGGVVDGPLSWGPPVRCTVTNVPLSVVYDPTIIAPDVDAETVMVWLREALGT